MLLLVCVFLLTRIPERKERDMKSLLFMFIAIVSLMVWTIFNGYPGITALIPMLGLFVLVWAAQEIVWKR